MKSDDYWITHNLGNKLSTEQMKAEEFIIN